MSAMKLKKRYRFLIALCVLGIAFTGWDWYMRNSWDNHIVSNAPQHFSLMKGREGFPPHAINVDYKDLPDYYKQPIDIVKRDGYYYWRNNGNLRLTKTVEFTEFVKNDVSDPHGQKWIFLSSDDGAIRIKIRGNNYLGFSEYEGFGCYRRGWHGDTAIQYDLNKRKDHHIPLSEDNKRAVKEYLAAWISVDVYENVFQYFYCK